MIDQNQIKKIKEAADEFFSKMTMPASVIEVSLSPAKKNSNDAQNLIDEGKDVIDVEIKTEEPQILIGQQGQTLFEIQRLLRTILNKKLQKVFYLNLDINDYKKKKIEYLKVAVKELADQVSLTKEEKSLLQIIHFFSIFI